MAEWEKATIVWELEEEYAGARGISTDLAIKAGQYTAAVEIPAEYQQHAKVFSKEESRHFPPEHPLDHVINLKPGSPDSLNCKIYLTMQMQRVELQEWIKDMKDKKYIEDADPDEAYIASSFFYIPKKDGKSWPVQDHQKVSAMTQHDLYPVPLIAPTIALVQNAGIFTKFDVQQGYNNIQIKKQDHYKVAFKTEFGMFVPNDMFFSLTNSLLHSNK